MVSNTDGGPWDVEFTGSLAAREQGELLVDGSGLVFAIVPPAVSEMQAGGSGVNEIQQLTAPVATGGTFTVTFNDGVMSQTTAAIPFHATLAQLETALENLANIGAGNVQVSGTDGGPWVVEFVGGGLENKNHLLMSVNGGGLTGLPVVEELIGHVAGANEVQTIALVPPATSGAFTLSFDNETTASLPFNATAAQVQAALENLASIQVGEVVVTSSSATGGPWEVEFTDRLAATNMPPITGDPSALSGGFSNSEITIVQDPAQPGVNERQTITMPSAPTNPEAGTFRLTFNDESGTQTTGDIPYNATAQQVEDALKALANIGVGNVDVTSPNAQGGPWTVEFTQALASTNLPLMAINAAKLSRDEPIGVDEVQAAGPTNELQTVTLPSLTTGGTFTLQFDDGSSTATTSPIPFNAAPSDVQASLEALANINPGDVRVRGGAGDPSVRETRAGSGLDNEIQTVTLPPLALGGAFVLTFDDGITSASTALRFDAGAQDIQDALEALANIGAGNVLVSGAQGGPFSVEFVGTLARANQPLLKADGTNLTQLPNGPWEVEFLGQFAAAPQLPLVANGSLLELTGLNPTITDLTQGSNGDPLVLKTTTVSEIVSIEQLQINGNGGDDTLIVRGAPDFPLGVIFDGGDGIDRVQLISQSSTPSFVSPVFPDSTQGVLTMDGKQIQLAGVEGGIGLDAGNRLGAVTFSGTDEGNEIRFAGVSRDVATIARDGQVTTTLSGFAASSSLTIRGEQGDDEISIAPNAFTSFSDMFVFGGGPSGADTIRFEGTPGDDVFVQTPSATSVKAGKMVINDTTVHYDGIEEVGIEGLAGLDSLTVREPVPGSNDNILFHPAVANDGSFQFTAQPAAAQTALAYYPVTYGSIETRIFDTGEGNDTITASTNSLPGVNSSVTAIGGSGTTTLMFGDQPTLFTHDPDGVDVLSLEIGTTVDQVSVVPGTGVVIAVNTSVGDDTLVYQPQVDLPVHVDLAASRIEQPGLGPVTFTSIEQLVIAGSAGQDLHVQGVENENRFSYRPDDPQAGHITLAGVPTSVRFTGIDGAVTLTGGPAVSDQVLVVGSNARDAFAVDLAGRVVRTVNASNVELKRLTLDDSIEVIGVNGGPGDDLFRVEMADSLSGAPAVHVDGGLPDASDRLVVIDAGLGNLVLHREGPIQRSGTISIDDGPRVSYQNVEQVDVLPIDPVTGGTGTDGLGRVVVFDTDVFEQNNDRKTPTQFADLAEATVRPNIDPAAKVDPFGLQLPGDEDWYRYMAAHTATLRFELQFESIGQLGNGAAGLPGDGQLRIDVYNSGGTLINRLPGEGPVSHTVGVEIGKEYFLRVRGATPDAVNVYDLNVISTDEVGPRITDVFVTSAPDYELFNPKPTAGPTPPVYSITIAVDDPVARRPGFLYEALNEQIASALGHFRLVGDHHGIIAISRVTVINQPRVAGELATAQHRSRIRQAAAGRSLHVDRV